MRIIGLTGGIASGKSTVAARLRQLGATVSDADQLARDAVAPGSAGLAAIIRAFGPEMLAPDGGLDRRRLGAKIFGDETARTQLNAIIHPHVRKLMRDDIKAALAGGLPAIVLDVPLLYEGGLDAICDEVWVVLAEESQQLERMQARDGLTVDEAKARLAAQLPLADKAARASLVIDNRGPLAATMAQVDAAWQRVLSGNGQH